MLDDIAKEEGEDRPNIAQLLAWAKGERRSRNCLNIFLLRDKEAKDRDLCGAEQEARGRVEEGGGHGGSGDGDRGPGRQGGREEEGRASACPASQGESGGCSLASYCSQMLSRSWSTSFDAETTLLRPYFVKSLIMPHFF